MATAGHSIPAHASNDPYVLIVLGSGVPAYNEAAEGIRSVLRGANIQVGAVTLDGAPAASEKLLEHLRQRPAIAVAVGSGALEAISACGYDGPVVATMILGQPAAAKAVAKISTLVVLDLPAAMVLGRLKELYPRRNRIALIRGPSLSSAQIAEIREPAHRLGFQIEVVECNGPKELLDSIGALRGRVDFLWTLPDSSLYSGPVVSALVLSGIRNAVPVLGFSLGMVRSGALLGFYTDYRELGVQTGESLLQQIEGQRVRPREAPRKISVAVNERVMRVFGLQYEAKAAKGLVVVK